MVVNWKIQVKVTYSSNSIRIKIPVVFCLFVCFFEGTN